MIKYLQVGLCTTYILLSVCLFILLLELSGVYLPALGGWLMILCWVIFCFCAAYVRTPIDLIFYYSFRMPVLEEEERLVRCFSELREKLHFSRRVRLMIDEQDSLNACAVGHDIIAVTKKLLVELTDEELKGILAHELGHLMSHDGLISAAFVTASGLPRFIALIYRRVLRVLWTWVKIYRFFARWVNRLVGAAFLVVLFYLLFYWHLEGPLFYSALFLLFFKGIDLLYRFFGLLLSRYVEYKQDLFAHQLGYGAGLRAALQKLTENTLQPVNPYFILMNSTHPVLYNRIRRLEELAGLR
jgi:Zn-dependent protease with chaperone function